MNTAFLTKLVIPWPTGNLFDQWQTATHWRSLFLQNENRHGLVKIDYFEEESWCPCFFATVIFYFEKCQRGSAQREPVAPEHLHYQASWYLGTTWQRLVLVTIFWDKLVDTLLFDLAVKNTCCLIWAVLSTHLLFCCVFGKFWIFDRKEERNLPVYLSATHLYLLEMHTSILQLWQPMVWKLMELDTPL